MTAIQDITAELSTIPGTFDVIPFVLDVHLGACECGESEADGSISWTTWETRSESTGHDRLVAACCRTQIATQAVAEANGIWFNIDDVITVEVGIVASAAVGIAA